MWGPSPGTRGGQWSPDLTTARLAPTPVCKSYLMLSSCLLFLIPHPVVGTSPPQGLGADISLPAPAASLQSPISSLCQPNCMFSEHAPGPPSHGPSQPEGLQGSEVGRHRGAGGWASAVACLSLPEAGGRGGRHQKVLLLSSFCRCRGPGRPLACSGSHTVTPSRSSGLLHPLRPGSSPEG